MLSTLSPEQKTLAAQVSTEWKNRTYNYSNDRYESDCLDLLHQIAQETHNKFEAILFIDSPWAALLAYLGLKKILENESLVRRTMISSLCEVQEDLFCMGQAVNDPGYAMSDFERIRNQVFKEIRQINLSRISFRHKPEGGNLFHELYLERNIQQIKQQISHYLWEEYFPEGFGTGGDYLTSSLNLYIDYNGQTNPWNYGELIFYDLMTRLGIMNDPLFKLHRSLLFSGVFDFFIKGNCCFVIRLPILITRNKKGRLHSYNGQPAAEFLDGFGMYFVKGRRASLAKANNLS